MEILQNDESKKLVFYAQNDSVRWYLCRFWCEKFKTWTNAISPLVNINWLLRPFGIVSMSI